MIGDPVALTVRRRIPRPDAALLARFADAPTGFVTDACNGRGCLDHRIRPLEPAMRLCGPALTALCGPGDILAAMAALDYARPGDVIVIAALGDDGAAKIGDLWAAQAKKLGVAGVVCDGLVRDIAGLLRAGLPVFALGWCPNSGFKNGPGAVNATVSCGGMTIAPGDIVCADRDGVVAVPLAEAAAIAAQLELVRRKEAQAEAKLARGDALAFWEREALEQRGALRFLDEPD